MSSLIPSLINGVRFISNLVKMKKVIIDCDAGLDDASALFIAAKAHKVGLIDLMAITAVHGNTSL